MVKRGINDQILGKMLEMQEKSLNKIGEITKGQAPFAQEPVDMRSVSNMFRSLDPRGMQTLVAEFGPVEVNRLLGEVMSYEMKREGGQYGQIYK